MKEYKDGKYTVHEFIGYMFGQKFKKWMYAGSIHREDGAAIEWEDGTKRWYINGGEYTEKDWQIEMRKLKLKALGI